MLYCPGVNRRHFLLTSLTGAIAAPRVVAAQRAGGVRRIAYLGNAPTTPVTDSFWDAFVAGLQRSRCVDGFTAPEEPHAG